MKLVFSSVILIELVKMNQKHLENFLPELEIEGAIIQIRKVEFFYIKLFELVICIILTFHFKFW